VFKDFYNDRPASPPVEWARWARRNNRDEPGQVRRLVDIVLVACILYLLLRVFANDQLAVEELTVAATSIVASAVLLPIFKFLYRCAKAPYGLLREQIARQQQEIEELRQMLTTVGQDARKAVEAATASPSPTEGIKVTDHVTAAVALAAGATSAKGVGYIFQTPLPLPLETLKRLVELREEAITQLLNRPVRTDAELQRLKADIDTWQQDVLGRLTEIGTFDEVTRFRVLGVFSLRARGGYNEEHNKERAMLLERIFRLESAIRRLGGPANHVLEKQGN
jgi:hypothetical protein